MVRLIGSFSVALTLSQKIYDCGDVAATPYDRIFALKQLEVRLSGSDGADACRMATASCSTRRPLRLSRGRMSTATWSRCLPSLRTRSTTRASSPSAATTSVQRRCRTLTVQTISLPLMRSIVSVYGPISVIHFDSHLDTWKPTVFGGSPSEESQINHGAAMSPISLTRTGTYWHWAAKEGLVANGTSIQGVLPLRHVRSRKKRRHSHDSVRPRGLRARRRRRLQAVRGRRAPRGRHGRHHPAHQGHRRRPTRLLLARHRRPRPERRACHGHAGDCA